MKKLNALLVFLISSLTITGISFIDGKVWSLIFLVVGMIAYGIVGVLFSIGVLHGKEQGKEAYALVFFLLILGGYAVYKGLVNFKLWVLAWPLAIKIIVPVILLLLILVTILLIIENNKKTDNQINE